MLQGVPIVRVPRGRAVTRAQRFGDPQRPALRASRSVYLRICSELRRESRQNTAYHQTSEVCLKTGQDVPGPRRQGRPDVLLRAKFVSYLQFLVQGGDRHGAGERH